jgi:shikimate kinase
MGEQITSEEFKEKLDAGKAAVSLVGMSGVGKSYLGKRAAAEAGFARVSCDEDIMGYLGFKDMDKMAAWLGQPHSPGFKDRERQYLLLEELSLFTVLGRLKGNSFDRNLIIDATGSVVHTNPKVRERLGSLTTIVALVASEEHDETMYRQYLAEPKPVVWSDLWAPRYGEDNEAALVRCYPELSAYRRELYREMAHVCVPMKVSRGFADSQEFLTYVQEALPSRVVQ